MRRLPVLSAVTGLGWAVLAASAAAWLAGGLLGWVEFVLAGVTGLCVLALSGLLMIGATVLEVSLVPAASRITVGGATTVEATVTNRARQRLLLVGVEVVLGDRAQPLKLPPALAVGRPYQETLELRGERRGVLAVGPATSVRGDPFGLLRRTLRWADTTEVFVHPRTVRVPSFGAGRLHDLEGLTTEDMSMSDLAFHTLRQYVPGDDRRHIHWPSSAKLANARPEGTFLVRQFRDTRRTHMLVVVDGDADAYPDPEDFETAVSAGASIALRTVSDRVDATFLIGDRPALRRSANDRSRRRVLDVCARAGRGVGLDALARRAVVEAPQATFAVLVTGAQRRPAELRRIASRLPRGARTVVICVGDYPTSHAIATGAPVVLALAALDDLPALLGQMVAR
jgi:uncharacterized protein (DUF58 family)